MEKLNSEEEAVKTMTLAEYEKGRQLREEE